MVTGYRNPASGVLDCSSITDWAGAHQRTTSVYALVHCGEEGRPEEALRVAEGGSLRDTEVLPVVPVMLTKVSFMKSQSIITASLTSMG